MTSDAFSSETSTTGTQIAEQLLRRRTEGGDDLAELVDMLSLDDAIRRQVVRIPGEIEAGGQVLQ
jgi:hypothetical protein